MSELESIERARTRNESARSRVESRRAASVFPGVLAPMVALCCAAVIGGCGGGQGAASSTSTGPTGGAAVPAETAARTPREQAAATAIDSVADDRPDASTGAAQGPPARQSLGDLLEGQDLDELFSGAGSVGPLRVPQIDAERVRANGIRQLGGKHLTLYTDLPDDGELAQLPQVFDQAVPQWCHYFELDPAKAADWRLIGYLMNDKTRFERAGLLPADLPPFLHGYQRDAELWMNEQPTAYYRRHLLLHEGTHGFMQWALGGSGPPWYMEGVAELLATHRWEDGRLTLNYFPQSKEETPHWGRIKVIKDDTQAGRALSLEQIMRYDTRAHLRVEPYAWCWAAAAFFDGHPDYRQKFRELRRVARDTGFGFSNRFYESLADDWNRVTQQWQNYVVTMDYGFDVAREAIDTREVVDLPLDGATVTVKADRGWQSSGYRLAAGQTYRIEAAGRYQVGDQPGPWWCEPGGVTLRYHRGLPLGLLLGAVTDFDRPLEGASPLVAPAILGTAYESRVDHSGTLFLRINDSPAELDDNAGEVQVRITPVGESPRE